MKRGAEERAARVSAEEQQQTTDQRDPT